MEDSVLKIKKRKYTEETTIVSMRIRRDMLRDIDSVAQETGRTRNEILTKCIEFAIERMEINN